MSAFFCFQYEDHLDALEKKITLAQERALEQAETDSLGTSLGPDEDGNYTYAEPEQDHPDNDADHHLGSSPDHLISYSGLLFVSYGAQYLLKLKIEGCACLYVCCLYDHSICDSSGTKLLRMVGHGTGQVLHYKWLTKSKKQINRKRVKSQLVCNFSLKRFLVDIFHLIMFKIPIDSVSKLYQHNNLSTAFSRTVLH